MLFILRRCSYGPSSSFTERYSGEAPKSLELVLLAFFWPEPRGRYAAVAKAFVPMGSKRRASNSANAVLKCEHVNVRGPTLVPCCRPVFSRVAVPSLPPSVASPLFYL